MLVRGSLGQSDPMAKNSTTTEASRQWLSRLVVTVITVVCLYSFARISIFAVIVVAGANLVLGLALSWYLGYRKVKSCSRPR